MECLSYTLIPSFSAHVGLPMGILRTCSSKQYNSTDIILFETIICPGKEMLGAKKGIADSHISKVDHILDSQNMNSDKADQNFSSDDTPAANTPRVDETGQQLEQSGWKVKANPKADVTRNIRRRDDPSSTCEKAADTNGGGLTKRKRLSDSLPSCEDAEGASERHSCERHRTGDSSSSSEEVEEESGEESRSGQRAYDSSSSCEETEQESGGVREMQCNISILQQNRWESMFARLIEFKEEHGHCLVPNRFEEDRSLGAWVSTQRRHYKLMFSKDADHGSTPLTKERIQKLQDVGFVWATSDPRHTPWDVRFNELRAYRETYGKSIQLA